MTCLKLLSQKPHHKHLQRLRNNLLQNVQMPAQKCDISVKQQRQLLPVGKHTLQHVPKETRKDICLRY